MNLVMDEDFAISVAKAFDALDIDAVADPMHDDMIFVDDYEMASREDFLIDMKQSFDDGTVYDYSRERRILIDQRDVCAMQYTNELEGVDHVVTIVGLKKEGKFWNFSNK